MGFYDDPNDPYGTNRPLTESDIQGYSDYFAPPQKMFPDPPLNLADYGGTGGFAGHYGPDMDVSGDPLQPRGPQSFPQIPIQSNATPVYERPQQLPQQGFWGNWLDNLATSLAQTPLHAPNNFGGGLLSGFAQGFAGARLKNMTEREKLQKSMDDFAAKRNEANIKATADAQAARTKRLEDLRASVDRRRAERDDLLFKTMLEAQVKANADGTFTLTPTEAKAMGAGYSAGQTVPKEIKVEALSRTRPDKPSSSGKGGTGQPDMSDYTTLLTKVQNDNDLQRFQIIRDGWAAMQSADDTPTGDIALVYAFMKLLDPGSTVMAGEYATAQNAAGVSEKVRNAYNALLTGKKLGYDQRANFMATGQRLYRSRLPQLGRAVNQYRSLASSYGLNPDLVIRDLRLESDPDVIQLRESRKGEKVAAGQVLVEIDTGNGKKVFSIPANDVSDAVSRGAKVVN